MAGVFVLVRRSSLLVPLALVFGLAASAQTRTYTVRQLTFDAVDHYNPSINNLGDIVWNQDAGGRQRIHLMRAGATSAELVPGQKPDWSNVRPQIDDAGNIVYQSDQFLFHNVVLNRNGIETTVGGGTAGFIQLRGFGISPNGLIFTEDAYQSGPPQPPFGQRQWVTTFRVFRKQYEDLFLETLNFFAPMCFAMNSDRTAVCEGIISVPIPRGAATPRFIAAGTLPHIADLAPPQQLPEIVYINPSGQVVSTIGGVVDTGTSAAVNKYGAVVYTKIVGGRSQIFIASLACGRPSFAAPYPTTSSPMSIGTLNGWHMSYSVSETAGLRVSDVFLGKRYLARSMSLPYFLLETTNAQAERRCTLNPSGGPAMNQPCSTRLVDLQTSQAPTLQLHATYEVSNISADPTACVFVRQDYVFSEPSYADAKLTKPRCEPGGTVGCAMFKPLVRYEFHPGKSTDRLVRLSTAQRFHFSVDSPYPSAASTVPNSSVAAHECDGTAGVYPPPPCNPAFPYFVTYLKGQNPLLFEAGGKAVQFGQPGSWDSYLQTSKAAISPGVPVVPGCPECVHIHWRWSSVFGDIWKDSRFPIIPRGSNQSVDFAVVRFRGGEESPNRYTELIQTPVGESLSGSPVVLWYAATGTRIRDLFFTHGGFFVPPSSGPSKLTATMTSFPSETATTVQIKLTNTGPGNVRRLFVGQVLAILTGGSGAVTSRDPLPIEFDDLLAGKSLEFSLVFDFATTVQKFLIGVGLEYVEDDLLTPGRASFTQEITR